MRRGQPSGPPAQRAADVAAGLKAGSWSSVEALALLALEVPTGAEADAHLARAHGAAESLRPGTWDAVRALSLLARADRERALRD